MLEAKHLPHLLSQSQWPKLSMVFRPVAQQELQLQGNERHARGSFLTSSPAFGSVRLAW